MIDFRNKTDDEITDEMLATIESFPDPPVPGFPIPDFAPIEVKVALTSRVGGLSRKHFISWLKKDNQAAYAALFSEMTAGWSSRRRWIRRVLRSPHGSMLCSRFA